uniref:Uncharacterized protein n=1 Tax=viral metagenome TaxID=1070528 RepID=A0A6M3LBC2_9ZZZZ
MKQGLSIHCHHNILVEYCYDYDERVNAIKDTKPKNEQEIRLRLFKLLPQEAIDELPERLVKADAEWRKAYAERKKASAKWEGAYAKWEKAYAEWEKADAEWAKADAEWKKAYAEWKKADAERVKAYAEWEGAYDERWNKEAWHKKWCGCKEWNGKEIVFENKEAL